MKLAKNKNKEAESKKTIKRLLIALDSRLSAETEQDEIFSAILF